MNKTIYKDRVRKCCRLMRAAGIDALLLTKPSNMAYLTGDGRLCAFAMINQEGKVALGVPQTDVKDVKSLASSNYLVGFEDEVGMIHSIAHSFDRFGIKKGAVGLEQTFLTGAMMNMLTHPHAKPEKVVIAVGNCGLYSGPWGVRVEDTVVVGKEGPVILTRYPRHLGR